MSPERKRKVEKEHFCAVVEAGSGLCKQVNYQAGKGVHPRLGGGLSYFCLTKEAYLYAKELIDSGRVFYAPTGTQEPERLREPFSGPGPKRAALSSDPQGGSLSALSISSATQAAPQPQEEVGGLGVPPFWSPEGLPPVSFSAFGRELREIEPGLLLLSWEGGPIRLSINQEPFYALSPLSLILDQPGSYRLSMEDSRFQPSSFNIEVKFPPILPLSEKKNG